ncbi:MAG TPA: CerR family C-terminal domain-containing protein [Phycisphaerales bacterium]|nr:CerR family C-terminal domain-containing protein [Phycisphaerales bacterium]
MIPAEDTTRSRLLDAAEELFAERGYEAVGIREIAERAGVNLSGIKYHFGSKHGLYLDTVRRSMDERGSAEAWALLDGPPATREQAATTLALFVRAFLRVLLGPEESASCACLVLQAALEGGDAAELVAREFIRPNHERLAALVGVLCPSADARLRSWYAQSVVAQVVHQMMFKGFIARLRPVPGEGEAGLDRIADEITAFSLRGMGCAELVGAALGALAGAGQGARER